MHTLTFSRMCTNYTYIHVHRRTRPHGTILDLPLGPWLCLATIFFLLPLFYSYVMYNIHHLHQGVAKNFSMVMLIFMAILKLITQFAEVWNLNVEVDETVWTTISSLCRHINIIKLYASRLDKRSVNKGCLYALSYIMHFRISCTLDPAFVFLKHTQVWCRLYASSEGKTNCSSRTTQWLAQEFL